MIRDRIVTGCFSDKCREKLINEGDKLTMHKAIQIVQNFENCQKQFSTMTSSGATGTSVDVIHEARTDIPLEVLDQRRHGRATETAQDEGGINSQRFNRQSMAIVRHTIRKRTASVTSKKCVDHDLSVTLTIIVNVTMCLLDYIIVT